MISKFKTIIVPGNAAILCAAGCAGCVFPPLCFLSIMDIWFGEYRQGSRIHYVVDTVT